MLSINVPPKFKLTTEQFELLASYEQENRMELTAQGELIIMPPTGGTAGKKNSKLIYQLEKWSEADGTGEVFDSSTMFILPNGARRSPDASWISLDRWNRLTKKEQDGFPPIAPDFVIELVSPSDLRCDPADVSSAKERAPREKNQRYEDLQNKMIEYIENEVKLGWLIEPNQKIVEVYSFSTVYEQKSPDIIYSPSFMTATKLLPGLKLDLTKVWE